MKKITTTAIANNEGLKNFFSENFINCHPGKKGGTYCNSRSKAIGCEGYGIVLKHKGLIVPGVKPEALEQVIKEGLAVAAEQEVMLKARPYSKIIVDVGLQQELEVTVKGQSVSLQMSAGHYLLKLADQYASFPLKDFASLAQQMADALAIKCRLKPRIEAIINLASKLGESFPQYKKWDDEAERYYHERWFVSSKAILGNSSGYVLWTDPNIDNVIDELEVSFNERVAQRQADIQKAYERFAEIVLDGACLGELYQTSFELNGELLEFGCKETAAQKHQQALEAGALLSQYHELGLKVGRLAQCRGYRDSQVRVLKLVLEGAQLSSDGGSKRVEQGTSTDGLRKGGYVELIKLGNESYVKDGEHHHLAKQLIKELADGKLC